MPSKALTKLGVVGTRNVLCRQDSMKIMRNWNNVWLFGTLVTWWLGGCPWLGCLVGCPWWGNHNRYGYFVFYYFLCDSVNVQRALPHLKEGPSSLVSMHMMLAFWPFVSWGKSGGLSKLTTYGHSNLLWICSKKSKFLRVPHFSSTWDIMVKFPTF